MMKDMDQKEQSLRAELNDLETKLQAPTFVESLVV